MIRVVFAFCPFLIKAGSWREIGFTAYYRFYSRFLCGKIEIDGAEHVAMVRDAAGFHPVLFCQIEEPVEADCPI
jgi:hypothetical protein